MSLVSLTQADSGRSLQLAPGDVVELVLPENPTTGFRWTVASPGTPVLHLAGDDFQRGGTAPGAGGRRSWRFDVASAGRAELTLELRRSWEAEKPPAARFDVTVVVGG